MKKLGLLIVSLLILVSCSKEHPKDYLSISGKLENNKDSILTISGFAVKKVIKLNEDGTFKDSLKVAKPNTFSITTNSGKRGFLYLRNGYDLHLKGDSNEFLNSFSYSGNDEGAQSNNFIIASYNYVKKSGTIRDFMIQDKEGFQKKLEQLTKGMDSISAIYTKSSDDIIKQIERQNETYYKYLKTNYDKSHDAFVAQEKAMAKLEKGKPAPEFVNYEDFKGGKKSLKDFRGNFVYIDVWATWCRPCLAQIPYLKKLEKEFEGKNISFVSISTDNKDRSNGDWSKARKKWATMVKDKNLGGTQLWAGKDHIRFSQEYLIRGIPRFILIDPEGNIVNHNEIRPSDPKISDYLISLGVK
ncbi:TlpA disulfide reductase family protein [Pseudotenacibaculum sp. MALMAid0570]|uniref:TlpA family protein disulfide reductase n=1 Tax=Pseudotenacibaculum sp. MALMAid0570 TaxID=3143938 RepID=UPI0032DF7504